MAGAHQHRARFVIVRRFNFLILLLFWLMSLPLAWLIGTEHGLHWLLARTLPPQLSIERVEGALIGPVRVEGLRYQDAAVTVMLEEGEFSWRLSQLLLGELYIKRARLQGLVILTPASEQSGEGLPDLHLPLRVAVRELTLAGLRYEAEGSAPFELNRLRVAASINDDGIHFDDAEIDGPAIQAKFSGLLQPWADYRHSLSLDLVLDIPAWQRLAGQGQLKGDLHQTRLTTDLRLPTRGHAEITAFDVLTDLRWQLNLRMARAPLTKLYAGWPALPVSGEGWASGDLTQMQVQSLTLQALGGELQAQGELNWGGDFAWFVDLEAKGVNPEAIWREFPGKIDLAGIAGGRQVSSESHIMAIEVERLTGELRDYPVAVQAGLEFNGDDWLIAHSEFKSAQSELMLKGRVGEQLALNWHLRSPALQQLHPSLAGRVDAEGRAYGERARPHISFRIVGDDLRHGESQLARIDADGDWRVNGGIDGHLRLDAAGLVVGDEDFQWLRQWLPPQSPALETVLTQLRQGPLQLVAEVQASGREMAIKQFMLSAPQNSLQLSGRWGDDVKLDVLFNSQSLAALYPDVSGRLDIRGTVGGSRQAPRLSLSFEGWRLVYQDGSGSSMVDQLQGRLGLTLLSWQDLNLNLDARDLYVAGESMAALRINANGDLQRHRVSAHMTRATYATGISVRGGYEDGVGWRGLLTGSEFTSPRWGSWRQQEAAADLSWLHGQWQLARVCWLNAGSRVCLNGGGDAGRWQGELAVTLTDLRLVNQLMPVDFSLHDGRVDLTVRAAQAAGEVSGSLAIDMGKGSISYPLIDQQRGHWHFSRGSLRGEFDRRGLRSKVDVQIVGGDGIKGHLNLPGFDPLAFAGPAQALDVKAKGHITDLGLFNNVLDEIFGVEGNIDLETQVSGTLGQPKINGRLGLRDGRLQVPRLGLHVSALEADVQSRGGERLVYQFSGESGGGRFQASGETVLDAEQGWETQLALKGERVEVSHIPEAHVFVDPDLQLRLKGSQLWLDGEVRVVEARLLPKELVAVQSVSDDVVIIGAEAPPASPWQISSRVRVVLAEPVYLYGFGFEGKIAGNLLLVEEPGQPTTANGEVSVVEGRYEAYGQNLTVEQGRMMFAGGPVSNPALDLRAVRKIDSVTAGIRVRGLLRQPEFELYSVPAMEQTDVLGYLVLGRPLDRTASSSEGAMMAQAALAIGLKGGDFLARSIGDRFGLEEMRIDTSGGGDQAALLMGRYLSPRLYVGYGVGLLDAVNTLHLRYQLSQDWQLKAESGEYQSADFIFSIER